MGPLVVTTAGASFITSALLNKTQVTRTVYAMDGTSVNDITASIQLYTMTTDNINPNQNAAFARIGRGTRNPNYMDYNLANTSVSDEDTTDINTIITCQSAQRSIVNGISTYTFVFVNTGSDTLHVNEIGYFVHSLQNSKSFLIMRGLLNSGSGFDIAPNQTLTVTMQIDPGGSYVLP